jgi:hypothetical protein
MKCSFKNIILIQPQAHPTIKMSTIPATPAMGLQKRKRTVVSYAELDQTPDLFSDDEDITTVPHNENSGDESDNDDRTYSKHKVDLSPSHTRRSFN